MYLMMRNVIMGLAVVAYAFNPITQETETGGSISLSLKPAWSTR